MTEPIPYGYVTFTCPSCKTATNWPPDMMGQLFHCGCGFRSKLVPDAPVVDPQYVDPDF